MTQPTSTRPDLDPTLKALLDAFPLTFKAADGVEAARDKLRLLKVPPEMLPDLRIEERTVGYGDLTDVPVRIYWPPIAAHENLPVVVFYHGGGHHPRVADVAVHQCLGVVHLDGDTGGGQ
jgi:acetyl esterase